MTSPSRAPLDRGQIRARRVGNALRSAALVAAMALLLGVSGWIVAGSSGLMVAAFFCLFGVTVGLRSPLALVLRLVSARPLPRDGFDGLRHRIARLARQAGLPAPPRLYYLSSPLLNAFSLGSREAAAIVMTSGLLQRLEPRELIAVLAHEISHIRHDDIRTMTLANVIAGLTRSMSFLGLVLLLANLPLLLADAGRVPWLLITILMAAPLIENLLQLALSRTREFEADLDAALLTGDPAALASALAKVERYDTRLLHRVLLPAGTMQQPSVLRSHPATEQRIRRLVELERPGDGERVRRVPY